MPATATISCRSVTDKLLLAADYKRVFWSESMNTITISQNGIEMGFKIGMIKTYSSLA